MADDPNPFLLETLHNYGLFLKTLSTAVELSQRLLQEPGVTGDERARVEAIGRACIERQPHVAEMIRKIHQAISSEPDLKVN